MVGRKFDHLFKSFTAQTSTRRGVIALIGSDALAVIGKLAGDRGTFAQDLGTLTANLSPREGANIPQERHRLSRFLLEMPGYRAWRVLLRHAERSDQVRFAAGQLFGKRRSVQSGLMHEPERQSEELPPVWRSVF